MKIRHLVLSLAFLSDLLVDANLIPRSLAEVKARLESRKRRKKPPVTDVVEDGWPKYFHEPGGSELANHYDSRYEHGILSYEEKQDTQVHMMRAYLDFFKRNNIETWLAHGTLLGWWWNGRVRLTTPSPEGMRLTITLQMLPWDWDIDTQVSGPSLMYLGKHFNGSIYDYTSADSDPDLTPVVERQYLLDVNPAIIERDRGNGNNVIDARWIDIRNGLYIDVTGLSETEPQIAPGVWSCKNLHHYKTTDLYPMRESMYEGVVAKVPYAYDRILAEEYQEKALVVTDYEGYAFHSPLTSPPTFNIAPTNILAAINGILSSKNGSRRPLPKSNKNASTAKRPVERNNKRKCSGKKKKKRKRKRSRKLKRRNFHRRHRR